MSRLSHEGLDTRPAESDVVQPRLGALGMLRWAWRQLTSMRTALLLLLLLAVAAVPGSVWPQRGVDAGRVADYLLQHPSAGPVLDRLGAFDVYSSPWFSAIYLLLFISLVGCVVPRTRIHWHALRAEPPRVPARLDRLPEHRRIEVPTEPEVALAAARQALRARRYRLRGAGPGEGLVVSAEAGYLRETGNLVFHAALILVIVGVGIGHLFGWRGDRIVPVGQTMSNTVSAYDTFDPGPWVDTSALQPFSITLDRFDAVFERRAGGAQFGAPRQFTAHTTTVAGPGEAPRKQVLQVNGPLQFGGASAFLLGNGYAPVVTVRDGKGEVLYSGATPFLAQDNNYRSTGAVKVASAVPRQLGFLGVFVPTAEPTYAQGPQSLFPDLLNPELAMSVFEGELYRQGRPQSVYTLDTDRLTQVRNADGTPTLIRLTPGQTFTLPGGRGSITFDSVQRWAGLSVRYDPGKPLALAGSVLALLGLVASLTVRRRRVFVRVTTAGDPSSPTGRTVVHVAGIAKGDDPGLGGVVADVAAATRSAIRSAGRQDSEGAGRTA